MTDHDENSPPRFSDSELVKLRADFQTYKKEQAEKWDCFSRIVERNVDATKRLTESIDSVAASTEGIVKLYQDIQGAARIGTSVQRFLTWLLKFGAYGAFIVSVVLYVVNKFSHGGPGH